MKKRPLILMAICFGVGLASAETKETNSLVLTAVPSTLRKVPLLTTVLLTVRPAETVTVWPTAMAA